MNFLIDSPYKKYIYILFAICFSVLVYRAFNVSVYDSGRARNQIYGDGYSDINTISSAKFFLDSGFTQTVFYLFTIIIPILFKPKRTPITRHYLIYWQVFMLWFLTR